MAVSISQQTQATLAATSGTLDTTGMTLIVVWTAAFHASISDGSPTITDNKGNTYTLIGKSALATNIWGGLYYCANPTVGTGHTWTYNLSATTDVAFSVWADNTIATPALDQGSNATFATTTAGGTTLTSPTINTAAAVEILVSGYTNDDGADTATISNGGSSTPSTAWTKDQEINGNSGMRTTFGHAATTASGSYAATWTASASTGNHVVGIASFKNFVVTAAPAAVTSLSTTSIGWTQDDNVTHSNLWTHIDEQPASDADFIESPPSPVSSSYLTRLGTAKAPMPGPITLHTRVSKSSIVGVVDCVISLVQGDTVLQSFTHPNISTTWTQFDDRITVPITDWVTPFDVRIQMNESA